MAVLSKSVACIRVIGDDVIPNEISLQLECEPTKGMIKDEPFSWNKSGEPRIARSGMWRLEAQDMIPADLDLQVQELLGSLTSNLEIWASISSKYKVDMFCGLFMESQMEGIGLNAKSLLELGQRGIEIDFDMYGPD
jgi:hypothetical protein